MAAALVTASFLMSPVIEDVFGKSNSVLVLENSLELLIKFWCENLAFFDNKVFFPILVKGRLLVNRKQILCLLLSPDVSTLN